MNNFVLKTLKSKSQQLSYNILTTSSKLFLTPEQCLEYIPLLYRAIRIRCNTLTSIPLYIYNFNNEQLESYAYEKSIPLKRLLWIIEAHLLLKGNAYIRKYISSTGVVQNIELLNPYTIQSQLINNKVYYWQQVNTLRIPEKGYFGDDELHIITEFNPFSNYEGFSSLQQVFFDAKIGVNLSRMLAQMFEGDGIPVTLIVTESELPKEQAEKIENWFRRKFSSLQKSVMRVLGISGNIKIERLTSSLKDYDIDKVDEKVFKSIADAFDIPLSLLRSDSGANRAISDNDRKNFLVSTIQPRAELLQQEINQLLKPHNQRIEFVLQELSEFQEDENRRSQSLLNLVQAGVPLVVALDILGYYIPQEYQELLKNQSLQASEKMYLLELDKWERKAINAMKTNGTSTVEFKSYILPNDILNSIASNLKNAKTIDDIKNMFKYYKEQCYAIS